MKLSLKTATVYSEAVAALYILLFLYTGITKTVDAKAFDQAIKLSPLIRNYSEIISLVLPPLEILIAFALMARITRFYGLVMASSLMLVFAMYVTYIISSDEPPPCLCGGIIQQLGWWQHLILNYSLLFLGLAALFLRTKKLYHDKTGKAEHL